jgi:hypothetical protein
VVEETLSLPPLAEPKSTPRTLMKFLPVTVTVVPPAVDPDEGETLDTEGLPARAWRLAPALTAARAADGDADKAAPINPKLTIPTPVRRASA